MEGTGDDRSFRVSFSDDGLKSLQDRVKDKLKEFMGDYTDDTLVEYIVVLLRNGRRKDEARKELDVFLGDDSVEFVSWLWDHLSSNVHLYMQQHEPFSDNTAMDASALTELPEKRDLEQDTLMRPVQSELGHEREKLRKVSRGRHGRGWKGLVQEDTRVFPLRSVVSDILHLEERNHNTSIARQTQSHSRSGSPVTQVHRKRTHDNENLPVKKDSVVAAPRRLLQFAVRDAVKTVQSNSRNEPPLKRLRSEVSTRALEVHEKKPHKARHGSRKLGTLSTALKAAAEAAEDVSRSRTTGNVFDRLGHDQNTVENVSVPSFTRVQEQEELEYEDYDMVQHQASMSQHRGTYTSEFAEHITMCEEAEMSDSVSDNYVYDNSSCIRYQGLDASRSKFSATRDNESLQMEYSKQLLIDQSLRVSSAPMTSNKVVNTSVNNSARKPSHFEIHKGAAHVEKTGVDAGSLNDRVTNEDITSAPQSARNAEKVDVKMNSQKAASVPGSHSTGRPSEDVDSRTLFVSNVHFAATKDTLSRHFNKFGDVLKVIIVNDAATGQPTGSAYVEFLKKESADLALALNGTSFMSRILKVVRRSSHEASPALGWSRAARSPAFPSRVGGMAYSRGLFPGPFRARLTVKPGARSLQWKREPTSQSVEGAKGPTNTSLVSGNNIPSPTTKSLTYTRTADATAGPA